MDAILALALLVGGLLLMHGMFRAGLYIGREATVRAVAKILAERGITLDEREVV